MDPAVIVALVTAVASLVVAVANGVMAGRREAGLATHESALRREESETERLAEAEVVLERYRGPLLAATFDLQDRLVSFREPESTRAVGELVASAGRTFADDRYGQDFMLWREEQRAIGERMIDRDSETANCVGYATFVERYREDYASWFERFEQSLDPETAPTSERLEELCRILRSLVAALDPEELRYTRSWEEPLEPEAREPS
jgi:hypothetical protein